jgi:hypothetical protein
MLSISVQFPLRYYTTVPASYSGAQKFIHWKQYGLGRMIFKVERHNFTNLNTGLHFYSIYLFGKVDVCNFEIIISSHMLVKKNSNLASTIGRSSEGVLYSPKLHTFRRKIEYSY